VSYAGHENSKRLPECQGDPGKDRKTYLDWFAILDAAGARKMSHQEIVAILHSRYRLGRWWEQKLTITYEHERGLRKKHETQSGYQISVSRTLPFPASQLFNVWRDKKARSKWLINDALTISTATANRMLRGFWENGKNTRVEVGFYPRGQSKCQVVVQHTKLGGSVQASQMKKYWSEALDRLKNNLDK
jgi:hypothetical protein